MTIEESETGLFFVKPSEVVCGRVIITRGDQFPYKVVFRIGDRMVSEHPVATVREGEAMIRREIAHVQFTTTQERPDPQAPPKRTGTTPIE